MFWKVIKGILLVAFILFYVKNVYDNRDDLYGAILFNRVNFIVLVAILYLVSDFVKGCASLCMAVIVGGILFHGYMYYSAYMETRTGNTQQTESEKCHGSGSSWYSKLNSNCYK